MKIERQTGRILAAAQLDAAAPVREIAERAGVPQHVAQYQLRRLSESGVLRYGAVINHYRLGLQQWQIYLALDAAAYRRRGALLQFLQQSGLVYWVAELGGEYQIAFSVTAPAAQELSRFLSQIATQFKSPFAAKRLSQVLGYSLFAKKYLTSGRSQELEVSVRAEGRPAEVDRTDHNILAALAGGSGHSNLEIAKALGIPRTTLEYRLRRLQSNGVITARVFYINSRMLGYQTFRLLVKLRGMPAEGYDRLHRFALRDPNITFMVQCLGEIDFELVAEVAEAQEVAAVIERLHLSCGELTDKVEVLPVFHQTTSAAYMRQAAP